MGKPLTFDQVALRGPCPYCKAAAGVRCRTKTGKPAPAHYHRGKRPYADYLWATATVELVVNVEDWAKEFGIDPEDVPADFLAWAKARLDGVVWPIVAVYPGGTTDE